MKTSQTIEGPLKQHLNHMIRDYFTFPLYRGEQAPEVPEDPTGWVIDHFLGMEVIPLLSVVVAITMRGATPGTCARYAHTRDVEIPFIGGEQAVLDVMIDTLLERGYDVARVAQVIEILALVTANAGRVVGIHPMSPLYYFFSNTSPADA